MQIDEVLLERLEKLSALKLNCEEKQNILKDLEEVLGFANVMNEINLDNISDTLNISNSYTPMRDDVVVHNNSKEIIFQNTKTEDNYFVVPKIIE